MHYRFNILTRITNLYTGYTEPPVKHFITCVLHECKRQGITACKNTIERYIYKKMDCPVFTTYEILKCIASELYTTVDKLDNKKNN